MEGGQVRGLGLVARYQGRVHSCAKINIIVCGISFTRGGAPIEFISIKGIAAVCGTDQGGCQRWRGVWENKLDTVDATRSAVGCLRVIKIKIHIIPTVIDTGIGFAGEASPAHASPTVSPIMDGNDQIVRVVVIEGNSQGDFHPVACCRQHICHIAVKDLR